jgi:hypothetical protein
MSDAGRLAGFGHQILDSDAQRLGQPHHPVHTQQAAKAVQALLLQAWRDYPKNDGPLTRSRTLGEEG